MVQMQPGTNIMQSSLNFIPYQTYTQHPNFQHATVLHEVNNQQFNKEMNSFLDNGRRTKCCTYR